MRTDRMPPKALQLSRHREPERQERGHEADGSDITYIYIYIYTYILYIYISLSLSLYIYIYIYI